MSGLRRVSFWFGVALVAVYAVRAVSGVIGGVAYSRGSRFAAQGDFYQALRHLEWAASGLDPAGLAWLRAQVRQGLWERMLEEGGGRTSQTDRVLRDCYNDYAEAIRLSPASGWYLTNLGDLYQDVEIEERVDQVLSLDLLDSGPWAFVGRPGRIAIGLCRLGIAREPNVYTLQDRLALLYFDNGLTEPGLEAVRESARIQPMWYLHPFRDLNPMPEGLLDAFAEASREALGDTPLLGRSVHLVALGKVELQRGEYAQAEADLRAALAAPGHWMNHAEASYYLGYALMEQERYDEALEALLGAEEHPSMVPLSLAAQALVAERTGHVEEALELLRRLRRLAPRTLAYTLEFARVARRLELWEQCEDALKWARITHPGDARPHADLVLLYIDTDDPSDALRALDELARVEGESDRVVRLRQRIQASRAQ